MAFHTFDPAMADRLEDVTRFRFCSREELLQHLQLGDSSQVLDHGSGTGFYTDELAPWVGSVVAFDSQPAMHARYRERGIPSNVGLVTGHADTLPFEDDRFDAAISTMTFHEVATADALSELNRCLVAGGPAVFVDWSANGTGDAGPSLEERFAASDACERLGEEEFTIKLSAERSETFIVVADA